MTDSAESKNTEPEDWRQPSLAGLASLTLESVPGFEVLLLDDLAAYLMGSGPLEPPYTVEHGSRVVSALFKAIANAGSYSPQDQPVATEAMVNARTQFVEGAHSFAAKGADGLSQLVNRLIPAALGELERNKEAPELQTCSLFYYAMLAVASGPRNLLSGDAADAMMDIFHAWDTLFGDGFMVPWRSEASS